MSDNASGLSATEYWSLSALAVASIMLAVINISLSSGNREVREELVKRQLFVNETVQLERFRGQLIKVIAEVSVRTDDTAMQQLLSENGITIRSNPAQPVAQ